MFTTLVETRAVRHRSVKGTITSLALHAAAIGAAVMLTVNHTGRATEAPEPRPHIIFTPTSPPVHVIREPRAPAGPATIAAPSRTVIAPVDIPNALPPIDFAAKPIGDNEHIVIGPGLPTGPASGGPTLAGISSGGVVDESAVERAPQLIGNATAPRYPSALRESGIAGRVTLRFVIDTTGRAEMADVITMESTHPLFADAVKNVLVGYRFRAGEVGGRKVRTLVQMPFVFTLR